MPPDRRLPIGTGINALVSGPSAAVTLTRAKNSNVLLQNYAPSCHFEAKGTLAI